MKTKETRYFLFPQDCSSIYDFNASQRWPIGKHQLPTYFLSKKTVAEGIIMIITIISPVRDLIFYSTLLHKTTLTFHRYWIGTEISASMREKWNQTNTIYVIHFFRTIWTRLHDPWWRVRGTDQSLPRVDSSVPLLHHDPSDRSTSFPGSSEGERGTWERGWDAHS